MCFLARGARRVSTNLQVFVDGQLHEIHRDRESVHCVPKFGNNLSADRNLKQGRIPLSEETESVSMQRECFLLRVCSICMGTFVSGCSRNLCLSSKGMNVLLGGEGGGDGAQEADSCTSGLLCDQYSRGKWGLAAGMVSRGMTSCDLLLVL